MTALERACTIALRDCLGVKSAESLLVVTDGDLAPIGRALLHAARQLTDRAIYVEFPAAGLPGASRRPASRR